MERNIYCRNISGVHLYYLHLRGCVDELLLTIKLLCRLRRRMVLTCPYVFFVVFLAECLRVSYSVKRFGCSLDKSSKATAMAELPLPQNSKGTVITIRCV